MYLKTVLYFLIMFSSIFSAYLRDIPQEIKQPDGSIINCFSSGDEFYNWVHDEEGYTIVRSEVDGYCYYANEDLTPSSYKVGEINPNSLGIRKWIKLSKENWILTEASNFGFLQLFEYKATGSSLLDIFCKLSSSLLLNAVVVESVCSDEQLSVQFTSPNSKSFSILDFSSNSSFSSLAADKFRCPKIVLLVLLTTKTTRSSLSNRDVSTSKLPSL